MHELAAADVCRPGPVGDPVGSAGHLRVLWFEYMFEYLLYAAAPGPGAHHSPHSGVGTVSESKFEGRHLGRLSFEPAR